MVEYRHYRNCDPPGIVELWRSQPPLAGRVQPLTIAMLENFVLAKPYFDPPGLIVAVQQDHIVGMAHAGFGPAADNSRLCYETGMVCMLLVAPHAQDRNTIAAELIQRAEDYLRAKGAESLYAGSKYPHNPFYLGLYGGSEAPGILADDVDAIGFFDACGYRAVDEVAVLECDLVGFRPKVDRKTLQVRRKHHIEATFDPRSRNWWEACTYGSTDRTQFVLRAPGGQTPACSATFWDLEPLASSWGVQAVGLVELETAGEFRRQGLATFLVGEALRQLHAYGVSRCQVQVRQDNDAALGLFAKLGFEESDGGIVLRKQLEPPAPKD